MRHQTGNEMHVAREAIELGDHELAPHRPRFGKRRRQLRPVVERVASLASFDLDEFGRDIEAHFLREPGQRILYNPLSTPFRLNLPLVLHRSCRAGRLPHLPGRR
jgi:hypothetical protein